VKKSDELADPNSCLNKAGEDEILFVVLDRDEAFPGTVRFWIKERIKLGLNRPGDAKLLGAEQTAAEVERLQEERKHGS
jgi:hypothetical protein